MIQWTDSARAEKLSLGEPERGEVPAEGIKFTRTEIATYYAARLPDLKQGESGEWRGPCPIHQGDRDSFAVDPATGRWFCHSECGRGGSIYELEMALTDANFQGAKAEVHLIVERTSPRWRSVAEYVYTDESAKPLFRVIRRERGTGKQRKKTFHLERHEAGNWLKGLGKVRRVPYRLHKVVNAKSVIIVEGEKDCNTLRKWRLVTSTSPMGANNWSSEYSRYFKGKHIVILPDNDRDGRAYAMAVASSLVAVAASIRVVELPGVPEKGDVTDWASTGGTREQLRVLISAAPVLDAVALASLRKQWAATDKIASRHVPFQITDDGLFWLKEGDDPVKIAARVDVIAQTRDAASENWGRLLEWRDNEGCQHQWAMPMELLASDAGAVRARLLAEGLPYIAPNARLREQLTEYLQTAPIDRRVRCVGRIGWHDGIYVLPDIAIAPNGREDTLYQTAREASQHWNVNTTPEQWREEVGQFCCGNSRLVLAVSCAFAGPLLALVGAESGGIHFHGATSTGKSTTLMVGGSVCGGGGQAGFVQTWRTTINGLEAIAEGHNDGALFLDELSQVDAREAAETAYLLGNEQGKQRMNRSMGARKKLTWKLLYVSAGEMTVAEHAASVNKRTRGGAEVRLLNIEADAGGGLGLFENIHGAQSAEAFSRQLRDAAMRFYGAPLRAFLEILVRKPNQVAQAVTKFRTEFLSRNVPAGASGEVPRAALRFALIGAAGELATRWGLTGWNKGEAIRVAKRLFNEWMNTRGTRGSSDMEMAVRQMRMLIQAHGVGRFPLIRHDGSVEKDQVVRDQAGFRRTTKTGETEYLIYTEIFKSEFCKGYSWQAVAKELHVRGYLRRTEPHMTVKVRLPGNKNTVRVYCVREAILKGDE